MTKELRATVVVDYQNMHLVGHSLFEAAWTPRHETLVEPGLMAAQAIEARNRAQKPGHASAVLRRVLVFRGEPSPEYDTRDHARSQAQKSSWEKDRRVVVTLRPLKYEFRRDDQGHLVLDHLGRRIVEGKREKGVDVLCALALVRETREEATDLVIMASSDSDLAPALDEARSLGSAKVETLSWYERNNAPGERGQQLRPTTGAVWNTQLDRDVFVRCRDLTRY